MDATKGIPVTQLDIRASEVVGQTLVGTDGNKIGEIKDVYLDDATRRPEWFAVKTGMFGSRVSFVPTREASAGDDSIVVPYDKAQVKDAPNAEADGQLSEDEEARLSQHYGISYGEQASPTTFAQGGGTQSRRRADAGSGDSAMTRSEEEVVAGTRQREAKRARLVKYVETEHQNVTVPVKRERAKLVTEPITDENRDEAMSGPDIRENAYEATLYEEEPVVETRAVPKERVRLDKETDTEQEQVGADVRKERIRTEGDIDDSRSR